MNGPEFFETRMGKTYYEHTLPALVDALVAIRVSLEQISAQLARLAPPSAPEQTR